ncbi:hypothetical protein SLS62_003885 [Diatrype stigma]|uniref:Uncharacterized protein n=1 Tax=Diatrype stigma TaxID=117547 RepID=A0AAN9YU48_9PEZI
MGGSQEPFMYDAVRSSSQFPEKEFDPKAVTRASWEPKPRKPKVKGPLVAFGRHPDAHQVPSGRTSTFRPMSGTTKWWIRWTRYLQLGLRSLELVAGLGLVALMILISNVQPELVWVMRIVPGVVAISCIYSLYHHARPARERPPASSAAYQLFSAVHDAAATGLYAFGAVVVHSQGGEWATLLKSGSEGQGLAATVLVPAEYWALVGAAGLHAASLGVSTYLALMFRRIARMPPDLNPLEDHLTRRAHKRNKSSVATTVASWESIADGSSSNTKRISTRLEEQRRSGAPYEDLAVRPPSIPFMHTRTGSKESFASSATLTSPTTPNAKRDSRADLPSRQYQILPGKGSPASANTNAKRMSAPPPPSRQQRGSYAEIPLHDPVPLPLVTSRPASIAGSQSLYNINSSSSSSSSKPSTPTTGGPRTPRFTETWYASDSLVGRTQERLRAAEEEEKQQQEEKPRSNAIAYAAILQPYDNPFDSDSDESDRENHKATATMGPDRRYEQLSDSYDEDESDYDDEAGGEGEGRMSLYPDPLRAHPPIKHTGRKNTPSPQRPRPKTPFRQPLTAALSVINPNARSASGSRDIVDEASSGAYKLSVPKAGDRAAGAGSGSGLGRNRDSSIQPEDAFYARPYGDLKPATPPVMLVGSRRSARQVSSGHDYYDLGSAGNGGYGPRSYRRNVSGKVAEEGLAGPAAAQQTGGGYSRNILKGFMASMPT